MNGVDGKQKPQPQQYVSSFSMVIKPPASTHKEGSKGASTTRIPGLNGVDSKGMAGGGKGLALCWCIRAAELTVHGFLHHKLCCSGQVGT